MSLIDAEKVVIREMDLQFWSDERIVAVFRHWDWFKEAKRPQKFESVA